MARNFCGHIDLDSPTDTQLTTSMAQALNLNNLYSTVSRNSGNASFASLFSANFPKPAVSQFMQDLEHRFTVTSFALISNTDELIRKLGLPSNTLPLSSDELILRLYLKFGDNFTEHIYGDWSLAIWSHDKQELFLSRNQHGGSSLFYYRQGNKLYFSTLLVGLLQIEGLSERIDEEKLFSELCRFCEFEDRTLYQEVKFLQPGYNLIFSSKGIQLNRYWVLETTQVRPVTNEQACFDRFLEIYTEAVESRLNIPMNWGTTLSGGLDSGSTTTLYSQYAKARNQKLEAFSYIPYYNYFDQFNSQKRLGNEKQHILDASEHFGNVNLNLITKEPKGFVDFLSTDFETFGHPPNTTNNWWIEEVCKVAKTKSVNAILIAEGGNASVSFTGLPTYMNPAQFFEDTRNGLDLSVPNYLLNFSKSLAAGTRTTLKRTAHARKKRLDAYCDQQTIANRDFYEAINGSALIEHQIFDRNQEHTPGKRFQINKIEPGVHCRLGLWNQLGTKYDMVFVDTTRDVKLLEYLVSLPNHMYWRKGMDKYLIRNAFKGLMPDSVLFNKKRAMQMSDIAMMYKQDIDSFKNQVAEATSSDFCLQYIDSKRLNNFQQALGKINHQNEAFTHSLFLQSTSIFMAFFLNWYDKSTLKE